MVNLMNNNYYVINCAISAAHINNFQQIVLIIR